MTAGSRAPGRKGARGAEAKQLLPTEWLKLVADGVAKAFGSRCEVSLHDLTHLERSIIKIANGHVTGRTVGSAISEHGLKQYKTDPNASLHSSLEATEDGRHLKSTSMVFKNDMGQPILALTINFDVTDIVNLDMAMKDIFGITDEDFREELVDTFGGEAVSTMNGIADNVIQRAGKAIQAMTRQDRIGVVAQLEDQGFFLIKGAAKFIARKLGVAASTIYSYLHMLRTEKTNMSVPAQPQKVPKSRKNALFW